MEPNPYRRGTIQRSPPTRQNQPIEKPVEASRGEELRRQIRQKEAELESIEQNKNQIRLKLKSVSPMLQQPLRQSSPQRFFQKDSDFNYNSSQLSITQQSPVREFNQSASLRHDSISVTAQENQQLMRRLNLVSAELDRVVRERDDNFNQMANLQQVTQKLVSQIDHEKNDNVSENHLERNLIETRTENQNLEDKLKQIDTQNSDAGFRLRQLKNERARLVNNTQELSNGLTRKIAVMKDIESQQFFNGEQIDRVTQQIQVLHRQLTQDFNNNHDIEQVLQKLTYDRDQLQHRAEQLQRAYDEAVSEITRESLLISQANRIHMQLMTSKYLVTSLESMIARRQQTVISELQQYCRFDEQCHGKLKTFAKILEKTGCHIQAIALKKWFQIVMDPLQTAKQSESMLTRRFGKRIREKYFQLWLQKLKGASSQYTLKLQSTRQIWRLKQACCSKDCKRAFQIWKDISKAHASRTQRLSIILKRQFASRLRQALEAWRFWNLEFDSVVRQHILTVDYADKQLAMIAYNQLKHQVMVRKRLRALKLSHLWKAWRDSNAYRRFMFAQNVAAIHLQRQAQVRLLQSCFQALRQSKEEEKLDIVYSNLKDVVLPSIVNLTSEMHLMAQNAFMHRKLRCLQALSNQARMKLYSYLKKWVNYEQTSQIKFRKSVKEVAMRLYRLKMHSAFGQWISGSGSKVIVLQGARNVQLSSEGELVTSELSTVDSKITQEISRIDRSSKVALLRAALIYNSRQLKQGMDRWHCRCLKLREMENVGARTVFKLIRRNNLKQAFLQYRQFTYGCNQAMRDANKCQHYLQTREQRLKRRTYNAIYQFIAHYQKARLNLDVLYRNMDVWLQRRTFIRWCTKANIKVIQLANQAQSDNSAQFDEINEVLGQVVQKATKHQEVNNELISKLKNQANGVLKNYFARFYYSKAARGVQQWKKAVDYEKHRDRMLALVANQIKRSQVYVVKAMWQNWLNQVKINELNATIKHNIQLSSDQACLNKHRHQQHQIAKQSLQSDHQSTIIAHAGVERQFQHKIEQIVRINKANVYQSRVRFIFLSWRAHTKRTVAFLRNIKNVLSKSILQNGFTEVAQFARDKLLTRLQNRCIQGMTRMYYKKACRNAINTWRSNRFENVITEIDFYNQTIQQAQQTHHALVERAKDWTGVKGVALKMKVNLQNYYRAWVNVCKWQKAARVAHTVHTEAVQVYRSRRALILWRARQQVTKRTRDAIERMKMRNRAIYTKAVFEGFRQVHRINLGFFDKLSTMAGKFDSTMRQRGFQMIRNFSISHHQADNIDKQVAATHLADCLNGLYTKKMTQYCSELRSNSYKMKAKLATLKSIIGHSFSSILRLAFLKFRAQSQKMRTVEDVNDEGPVVEQVMQEQLKMCNYQNYLFDQGYTKHEVDEVTQWAKGRSKELLARSVARLTTLAQNDDAYLKPKMFDRWKQFVKMRKLVRYLLNNMENSLQVSKADKHRAFQRWKRTCKHSLNELSNNYGQTGDADKKNGWDRDDMIKRCAKNHSRLEFLTGVQSQASEFKTQLQFQRDELVEKYMKGQRMAIAVGRDNKLRAEASALTRLSDNVALSRKRDLEMVLQRNIDCIAELKSRIMEYEFENDTVAVENEELRRFSMNGYQIAKNVQALQHERESLSVDLADKAYTIKQLLKQNEALAVRLRQVSQQQLQYATLNNY